MKCKITNEKIEPFMTFGKMPLANGFIEKKDFSSEFYYEMEVGFSEKISYFSLTNFQIQKKYLIKNILFYWKFRIYENLTSINMRNG